MYQNFFNGIKLLHKYYNENVVVEVIEVSAIAIYHLDEISPDDQMLLIDYGWSCSSVSAYFYGLEYGDT